MRAAGHLAESSTSPWLMDSSTVPTKAAIPSERFNRGGCRSAHRPHLRTEPAPVRNKKKNRAHARPQASHGEPAVGGGFTHRF